MGYTGDVCGCAMFNVPMPCRLAVGRGVGTWGRRNRRGKKVVLNAVVPYHTAVFSYFRSISTPINRIIATGYR